MRFGFVHACAAAVALGTLSYAPSAQGARGAQVQSLTTAPGQAQALGTAYTREPTLVYDVTGSTLIGPVHTSVVVYDDGLISYAHFALFTGDDGDSIVTFAPVADVQQLTEALEAAGAGALPDSLGIVADLPLTTVTFMKPATDTSAHTFSYFIGGPGHQAVSILINQFVQQHVFSSLSSSSLTVGMPVIGGGSFKQEPMLVYDVTGSTFAGPFHQSVTVFNNGHVSFSTVSTFNPGEAFDKTVPLKAVEQLRRDLAKLGAGSLADSVGTGADIPLTTVTYMQKPATDAKAHTFTYLAGGPGHMAVGARINTFVQTFVLAP